MLSNLKPEWFILLVNESGCVILRAANLNLKWKIFNLKDAVKKS